VIGHQMKVLFNYLKSKEALSVAWLLAVVAIYYDVTRRIDKAKEKVNDSIYNQSIMIDLQYQLQRKLDSINQKEYYETIKFEIIKDSIRSWTNNDQRRKFISDKINKPQR
jgi:hypothetical protein